MHIHYTHFIRLRCGMPSNLSAVGLVDDLTASYLSSQYGYDDKIVSCTCGAIAMKGLPFVRGFELYLERATLIFDSSSPPLRVWTDDGQMQEPPLEDGDPLAVFAHELAHAAQDMATVQVPEALSGVFARDGLQLYHQEIRSLMQRASA